MTPDPTTQPAAQPPEGETLKRCPFCPVATTIENWASRPRDRDHDVWCVFCHKCLCEGPEALTEAEAARLWNTRAEFASPSPALCACCQKPIEQRGGQWTHVSGLKTCRSVFSQHEGIWNATPTASPSPVVIREAAEEIDALLVPLQEYSKTPRVSEIVAIISKRLSGGVGEGKGKDA
jgi:hypothetical protein